ncbi:MAG: UDP-forming cellulose synthase catalytic subunit [Acetobacteraceae bacterium]
MSGRMSVSPAGWLALLAGGFGALIFVTVPLPAEQQVWLALAGLAVILVFNRRGGRRMSLFLMALSALVSLRYIHWRITETIEPDSFMQGFFMIGLLLAEIYAVLALLLGYFQTAWPLERPPAPLPEDHTQWPTVDVFIPTYNESLDVVRPTVMAALAMDWPADRFNVWILDDGRRAEFRAFAEEIGCGYIIRPDNKGAKAGNINHALSVTEGEYVAIFDCDHVPTRAFLQLTLGWLVKDRELCMVQTPHHFYSPDPFERNLARGRDVPNEGLLFYAMIQPGNDLWNAAFFCGSCAVIRRRALQQIGGVPTETVTEDAHCSLRMQRRGWKTAYLRVPLASGLATERLIIHIGQRMRWARGMLQIFRTENPLLASGLRLPQRLCYFAATFSWMFALPRVVFLTSPLAFLLFGYPVIAASPLAIIAYAGPHIVHAVATNSRITGSARHSFWSEIYETVLALHLLPLTIATMLDPKRGKFNVTDKGGLLEEGYFDMRAVWPILLLFLALLLGIGFGVHGLMVNEVGSIAFQAFLLNTIWATLCLVPVMAGLAVGRERKQVRGRARINAVLPAALVLPDGREITARTADLSLSGAQVDLADAVDLPAGTEVLLEVEAGGARNALPAEVVRTAGKVALLNFAPRTLEEEGAIVTTVLGRADAWLSWDQHRQDRPLRALVEVVQSVGGVFRGASQFRRRAPARAAVPIAPSAAGAVVRPRAPTAAAALLVAAALAAPSLVLAQPGGLLPPLTIGPPAAEAPPADAPPPGLLGGLAPQPAPDTRVVTLTLRQLGLGGPMQLRGTSDLQGVMFGIRADEVVTDARLVLTGAASPALIPALSQLLVTLNDEFVGIVQPDRTRPVFGPVEMPLDPVYFTETNRLNFRFSGRYTDDCNDPLSGLLWMTVSDQSSLRLTLARLPLVPDLARLPEPFFDARQLRERLALPVVLTAGAPVPALRAAVVATSWFAALADYRGASFPVLRDLPRTGHALMVAVAADAAALGLEPFQGPTLAVVPNPNDPTSQILIIGGRTPAETEAAAVGLVIGSRGLAGDRATVTAADPAPRQPYDAPRWLRPYRPVRFAELVDVSQLQATGFAPGPVSIPLRTAPDLYLTPGRTLPVDLRFRAPPGPVLDLAVSRMDVAVSGMFLRAVPLRRAEPSWPVAMAMQFFGIAPPAVEQAWIGVPPIMLSGQNELQVSFDMRPLNRGDCVGVPTVGQPAGVRAAIEPESSIDISGAHRFTLLPNLGFFASVGFPFTRMADLSETALVLPDEADPAELSAALEAVGRMAAAVGLPATGIAVVRASALSEVRGRDLLLVGALDRNAAVRRMLSDGTVRLEEGRLALALPDPQGRLREVFVGGPREGERARAAAALAAPPDGFALLASRESPFTPGRAVVMLTAPTLAGLTALGEALADPAQAPRVQGDLAVLSAGRIESFRVGPLFERGTLPFWLWPRYYLGDRPLALLGLMLAAALLLSWPLYRVLRARAERRLGEGGS